MDFGASPGTRREDEVAPIAAVSLVSIEYESPR
jgi:hypothetical protein